MRISSLGPEYVTEEFLSLFSKKRVHAYVHLSVQSGSDAILKKMGRKYGAETLREKLSAITRVRRDDGVALNLGADLIVGFPGETESDFEATLSVVREFGISQVHAFPFSPHEGMHSVPASKLPDRVDEATKARRMKTLLDAAREEKRKFLIRNDGKTLELLLEGTPAREKFDGWSENHVALDETNFEPFPDQEFARGKIVKGTYRYRAGAENGDDPVENTD